MARVNVGRAKWVVGAVFLFCNVLGMTGVAAYGQCAATELFKLTPRQAGSGDCFGYAAALYGDVAVLGAPGLNGARGATFVYRYDGASWVQEAMLTVAEGAPNDNFGYAVAVGDGVLVASGGRAAYVFRYSGGVWTREARLTGNGSVPGDDFGSSAALSGDTLLVGAQATNIGQPGAGYVFRCSGATWTQEASLVAGDGASGARLGHSAALVGGLAMLGAEQARVNGVASGAAYVFRRTGTTWTQAAKLSANDYASGDSFGHMVAIGDDRLLVGADADSNENGTYAGAVYVFRPDGANWVQETKLREPGGSAGDRFGSGVAIQGNVAAFGANDWNGVRGRAFVYTRSGASWTPTAILTATGAYPQSRVGHIVRMSGDTLLVGAPGDYIHGGSYGAAYVYRGLTDCQPNGVLDLCDIATGTSQDANHNGVPDECEQATVCPQWTPACVSPRTGCAAAYDAQRHVVVLFGGTTSDGGYNGETWEWDGTRWSFRARTGPAPRSYHGLVYDSVRHVVVLFGGLGAQVGGGAANLGDTWEWDGSAWTQRATGGPEPRNTAGMAFDRQRGVTVLFGGGGNASRLGDTWEWDGTTWTQRQVSGPGARTDTEMAYDATRHVTVLFGGHNGAVLGDTWEYDGANWTQRAGGGPGARYDGVMTYDEARGAVLLTGGSTGSSVYADTWVWNGTAWSQLASGGYNGRGWHASAYDSLRQRCVLFGGGDYGAGQYGFGDTWEWDGSAWALKFSDSPALRNGPFMAYDSDRGVTVLYGGWTAAGGYVGDTWEWNGTSWTKLNVSGPSARAYGGMTYDAARHVVLLFGGYDGYALFRETWAWNGAVWSRVATDGPPGRAGPAMTCDVGRGKALVFGGTGVGGVCYADTWEWDGTAWTQLNVTGPVSRSFAALAYDAARHVSVLFGGLVDVPPILAPLNDTWEWDGSAWTQRVVSAPPARRAHGLAYMDSAGLVTLFGGWNETPPPTWYGGYGETWDWNGGAWTRRFIDGPLPRGFPGMAYDAARQEALVFGGEYGEGANYHWFSDTWAYVNSSNAQILLGPPPLQNILRGDQVVYHVDVQTTGTTYFQWRRNGVNLNDNERITGSLSDALTIRDAHFADAGMYDVVVNDDCGPFASAAGQLIVGPPGDMNCDGVTDFDDINPFVLALSDPAGYQQHYPQCRLLQGDCNDDGVFNFDDINPFVAVLSGGN